MTSHDQHQDSQPASGTPGPDAPATSSELAAGVRRFREGTLAHNRELFERLAGGQSPTICWIGCSDSRLPAETILDVEPGQAFIIRTAGNIVPQWHDGINDPVAASIEFAVSLLHTPHIVVCGHSDCGAVKALATNSDLSETPALDTWLEQVRPLAALTSQLADPQEHMTRLTQTNVAAQIGNLRGYPSVQAALDGGSVTLHGWVFDIGPGEIWQMDSAAGLFQPLLPETAASGD